MKKVLIIGITFFLIVLISIVVVMDENSSKEEFEANKVKIGLSFDSLVVERWKRELEIFVALAEENGLEVIVQIANDNLSEQRKQIRYLIDENIKVLIILPNDFDALSEEILLAKRKGIKVIAYDRMIVNANVDAYISFDNIGNGESIAEKLIAELPQNDNVKNIVIINGDPKDYNSYMLNEGFYNIFNNEKNDKIINIIEEIWAHGWREAYAFNIVEKVLNEGVHIDAIVAANDVLATGAIEALSERQLAGKVLVVSQDAELSACQRIVEGTQLATIYKPINQLSKVAVEYSLKLIEGESLESEEIISDGIYSVPFIKIKCVVVDRGNIDKIIIDSGFHSKENVYMNINR